MCRKRKDTRASSTAISMPTGGATNQGRPITHRQLAMHMHTPPPPSLSTTTPSILSPHPSKTIKTYQEPSSSTEETIDANPPSYETIMNGNTATTTAKLDEEDYYYYLPAHNNNHRKAPFPEGTGDTESFFFFSSNENDRLFLTGQAPAEDSRTWWEAYRAWKNERREAWRAEKAEWRGLKKEKKGRVGRC